MYAWVGTQLGAYNEDKAKGTFMGFLATSSPPGSVFVFERNKMESDKVRFSPIPTPNGAKCHLYVSEMTDLFQ